MPTPEMKRPQVRWVPPRKLLLDPQNPRLAGIEFQLGQQDGILDWLWRNKSVDELVDSIRESGFWRHEELFATEEEGSLVVVEGNRRLAAVKVLTDSALRARLRIPSPGELTPEIRSGLAELPVLVQTRREIWEFIGFKHVNGPQAWDSIAKAQYVHRVHHQFGVDLDTIARTIGDRHDTVARLYRGYNVLEQARVRRAYDPEDFYGKRFPFSHLWTALGYKSVQDFLGVDGQALLRDDPVPSEKLPALGELMRWLFGSRSDQVEPKVKRQNPDLRDLAKALESAKGVQILNAGLPLANAVEVSLGDERLLQDALVEAEDRLRTAKRFIATGFHGEADLLRTADTIEILARSLKREMRDMMGTLGAGELGAN